MGIFKRVSDIVSANLNDLVDSFEDPETMLRQAVREMETALSSAMDGAARAVAQEKLLDRQLGREQKQADAWQRRAEGAVERGDDEAARNALRRKAEHAKITAALEDELTSARETSQRLRRRIEAMRVKLAEARRKLATLTARQRTAEARRKLAGAECRAGVHDEAFGRFDRLCERVERTEAEAEAFAELSGEFDDFEQESFDGDPEIDAELEVLKRSTRESNQ